MIPSLSPTAALSPASKACRPIASNSFRIKRPRALPIEREARTRDRKHLRLRGVVCAPTFVVGNPAVVRIGQMGQGVTQSLHQAMKAASERKERPDEAVFLAETPNRFDESQRRARRPACEGRDLENLAAGNRPV